MKNRISKTTEDHQVYNTDLLYLNSGLPVLKMSRLHAHLT